MDDLTRIIANAITINLANTNRIGLYDGKMGVCLFLFEYAKYTGVEFYRRLAESLLDDIYHADKNSLSRDINTGVLGVGFGLCQILINGFVKGEASVVLEDIDNVVMEAPNDIVAYDLRYNSGIFSFGVYLLSRLPLYDEVRQQYWIEKMIETGSQTIKKLQDSENNTNKRSILTSMQLVLAQLHSKYVKFKTQITILERSILDELEKFQQQKRDTKELEYDADMDMLCYNLWLNYVHNHQQASINIMKIETLVNSRLQDFSYYIETINSQLSIIGICLMHSEKHKTEFNFTPNKELRHENY